MASPHYQEETPPGLSASLEDYLEVIHHLQEKNKVARAKDIADSLGVTRGSVTGSLKALAAKGLIEYEPYSFITLTKEGADLAREVIHRHSTLEEFFSKVLHLDQARADGIACQVEHAVDAQTIERLVSFMQFLEECPRVQGQWLERFSSFCRHGIDRNRCSECLEEVGDNMKD